MARLMRARRMVRAAALMTTLAALTGCVTSGPAALSTGQAFGPTVAFESVDGPPPQVFERLVRALEAESGSRSFTIVSREAPAAYRIRSYLSAQVRRGKTTVAWVWDVYDRDQQRALRLSGEEPGGKAGRDAWAAADDAMMRRIAQAGLSGVSSLISGAGTTPSDPTPAPTTRSGPAVAAFDENAPEPSASAISAVAFSAH